MTQHKQTIPAEIARWPGHTGNWNRWPNDRGTLNLLTPAVALRGLAAVRQGQVIGCGRPLMQEDPVRPTPAAYVRMMTAGNASSDVQSAKDEMGFRTHGLMNTHIDAISHYGYHDHGFNGHRFSDHVTMEQGAKKWDVAGVGPIVTRGILVDVARQRGVPYLDTGAIVRAEEIAEAAERLEPGDAFIIRTGTTLKPPEPPETFQEDPHAGVLSTGLDAGCIEILGKKDVSVVATDTPNERLPVPIPDLCHAPVHVLTLTIYGMHLIHNMDLEALGEACAAQRRSDFLFMISPLNVPHATGSLVAPVAVL
jgi:kynurenine formamidase